MRASKAVTNIVGQLPFSCVCLCICHVSDTIIVYIKAESWVHIAFLSLPLSLLSTERPIGNFHDDDSDPLSSAKVTVFLFIYSDRCSQLFFVPFPLFTERTNKCGWKSNNTQSIIMNLYSKTSSSSWNSLTQLFQITKRFKVISSLAFCYWTLHLF